jgi:threonine dehydrogenase-like Zn-dependent dehydrogenase
MPRVLELMAAGTVRPELITSKVVSFEEAPEALLESHTKLVMVPA